VSKERQLKLYLYRRDRLCHAISIGEPAYLIERECVLVLKALHRSLLRVWLRDMMFNVRMQMERVSSWMRG
jgi:hypothetical protein